MVSIIIPIYNSELFLIRCLESIITQTYENYEVLLINNGSTDNSEQICLAFKHKDKRIKYFYLPSRSVSAARNFGIDNALGEYITFLDSDDTFEKTFIEKLCYSIKSNMSEIALCDVNYIDSVSGTVTPSIIRFTDDERKFNTCRTFVWGKIYRKSLFDGIRFPLIQFYEDVAVIPAITAKASKISYVPICLMNYYRNNKASLSENITKNYQLYSSLGTLRSNLILLGLYEKYRREFEKMCVSQIRFAFRRFSQFADERKEVERAETYLNSINPQITKLLTCKFYVCDKKLLSGVDKALIFADQIVGVFAEADYAVCFDGCKPVLEIESIEIHKPESGTTSGVSYAYDVAERIIEYFTGEG